VDRQELRAALQAFGFNVSDTFVSNLIQKFDRYGKQEMYIQQQQKKKMSH
jgi:Ca2+-binding EF-hand superfamily protein